MIFEWMRYLTTPCPRYVRKMGYLRETVGLESRAKRRAKEWQSHLASCRSTMARAIKDCPRRIKALVLGSGVLCEVPLDLLSAEFSEVTLVDMVHLAPVKWRAEELGNVSLVAMDVTGLAARVHAMVSAGETGPLPHHLPDFFLGDGYDLVISANLLSQISFLPRRYLEAGATGRETSELDRFAGRIVRDHLTWLESFDAVVCLISDIERLYLEDLEIVSRHGVLWGQDIPYFGREWIWDLAPKPEMSPDYSLRHRVLGVANIRDIAAC